MSLLNEVQKLRTARQTHLDAAAAIDKELRDTIAVIQGDALATGLRRPGSVAEREAAILACFQGRDALTSEEVVEHVGINKAYTSQLLSRLVRKGHLQSAPLRVGSQRKAYALPSAVPMLAEQVA